MSYFCFKNALKLTYVHLGLPKFFPGVSPGPKERGGEVRGKGRRKSREGREWNESMSHPTF